LNHQGQSSWKLLVSLGYERAIITTLLSAVKHDVISPFHLAVRNIEHFRARRTSMAGFGCHFISPFCSSAKSYGLALLLVSRMLVWANLTNRPNNQSYPRSEEKAMIPTARK
jgi:hypothetical protein